MYESCFGCSKPVLFTQAFCGKCGANLKSAVEQKRTKYSGWLTDAVKLAKEGKYDDAEQLLGRIVREQDFRFQDLTENASKALEKVRRISGNVDAELKQALERVRPLIDAEKHTSVIEVLKDFPEALLDKQTREALHRAREVITQRDELRRLCEKGLQDRDWLLVGPLAEQLCGLDPENEEYPTLARKVAARLIKDAERQRAKRRYEKAMKLLDAVPESMHDEKYRSLRNGIEDIVWLHEQFRHEPFDSPTLGRLAVRLTKEEPDEPRNQKLVEQIAANLKSGRREPRNRFPYRSLPNESWLGCKVDFLCNPKSLPTIGSKELLPWAGRLNVAFGLALQGIGKGHVDYNLLEKKGIFGKLTRRKDKQAWGVDLGATAIKVVGLAIEENEVSLVDAFVHEFEEPLGRGVPDSSRQQAIAAGIGQLLAKHDLGDAPVWVNLPANNIISRFVLLPPVPDKAARELIEREKAARIPMELDTMVIRTWMGEYLPESSLGRASMTIGAKKDVIQAHAKTLADAGLNVVGIQADPIALVNLVHHEFREQLDQSCESEEERPTVALFHCGAESTIALLVSDHAHWFWTMENGGEDLTSLIARHSKITRSTAEQRKRNPHQLDSPATEYRPLESRMDQWRTRLEKIVQEGLEQDSSFRLTHAYASGGGCFAHQWMRRMLLKRIESDAE
jgi:Tfp pilus assembly PilM family ATPase